MRKPLYVALITLMLAVSSLAFAADAPQTNAGVVNINSASAAQLALLPGIGEKTAQRIVEYRAAHERFAKAAELMEVKGVGAKTFERIAPHVVLSGDTTLSVKIKSPRKPRKQQQ